MCCQAASRQVLRAAGLDLDPAGRKGVVFCVLWRAGDWGLGTRERVERELGNWGLDQMHSLFWLLAARGAGLLLVLFCLRAARCCWSLVALSGLGAGWP